MNSQQNLLNIMFELEEYKNISIELLSIEEAKRLLRYIKFLQQVISMNLREIKNQNKYIEYLETRIKEVLGVEIKPEFFLKLRNEIENMYSKKQERVEYVLNKLKEFIYVESKDQIKKKLEFYRKMNIDEYKKYKLIYENYDKHVEMVKKEKIKELQSVVSKWVGLIMSIRYLEKKNQKYEKLCSEMLNKINKIL